MRTKEQFYKHIDSSVARKFYAKDLITTPIKLIEEIVDKLPKDLFTNKDTKFLDPCCGRGAFLLVIKDKLLEAGHSEKHII